MTIAAISLEEVVDALFGKRFSLEDEKRTQAEMWDVLSLRFRAVEREVRIAGGIIDFFVAGAIGVEVKLAGSPGDIVRQLKGYAEEPAIRALALVTAKPITLGPTIGNKPVAVLNLGRAWL